jgi:hypothetical protein
MNTMLTNQIISWITNDIVDCPIANILLQNKRFTIWANLKRTHDILISTFSILFLDERFQFLTNVKHIFLWHAKNFESNVLHQILWTRIWKPHAVLQGLAQCPSSRLNKLLKNLQEKKLWNSMKIWSTFDSFP